MYKWIQGYHGLVRKKIDAIITATAKVKWDVAIILSNEADDITGLERKIAWWGEDNLITAQHIFDVCAEDNFNVSNDKTSYLNYLRIYNIHHCVCNYSVLSQYSYHIFNNNTPYKHMYSFAFCFTNFLHLSSTLLSITISFNMQTKLGIEATIISFINTITLHKYAK